MTASYSNVEVTTDTFDTLITRTNQLLTALDTIVVTTDSNTAVGNSAITGDFTSNNIYTKILYGGVAGNTSTFTIGTNTNVIGYLGITQDFTSNNIYTKILYGGTAGNTSILTVATGLTVSNNLIVTGNTTANNVTVTGNTIANNIAASGSVVITGNTTANNVASVNNTSNNLILTHTLASSNTANIFYSSTGNTINKNDALGFRTSLDVYSKSETTTIADAVDASAIAYAIALG